MKTVLCYGDSNTWGHIPRAAHEVDTLERYDKATRWTGVLQAQLSDVDIIEEGLGSRTTTQPDPIEGEHKNGLSYLRPCLETHMPLDLVVLMLGTNDTKARFAVPVSDIAFGVWRLADTILLSRTGRDKQHPRLLILAPPPLGKLDKHADMFKGALAKSQKFASFYETVAQDLGVDFFDVGSVVTTSNLDGVHWSKESHIALAEALAPLVKSLLKETGQGEMHG